MWKEFRDFAFKGNVVDLAIGVIIGGVFGKTVTATVNDLIMPVVSLVLPSGEWQKTAITLRELPPDGPEGDARLMVGDLASVALDFLIVAFVLFQVMKLLRKLKHPATTAPNTRDCPRCLEKVPPAASRCKFCTSDLEPAPPAHAA